MRDCGSNLPQTLTLNKFPGSVKNSLKAAMNFPNRGFTDRVPKIELYGQSLVIFKNIRAEIDTQFSGSLSSINKLYM